MAGSSELAEVGRGEIRPEVVELLCRLRGEPALTTEEIASATGIPLPYTCEQLEKLRRQGDVGTKTVECDTQIWWA